MGSLLASLVPLALGVAFSPLGIVAIIVVLTTARPVRNGIGFDLGWLLAMAVVFTVTYAIASAFTVKRPSAPPDWVGWVHIVIGAVLLVSAAWILRRGQARVRRVAAAQRPADVIVAAPNLPAG